MADSNSNWVGLFCVDGGMTSGLCYGAFPKTGDTKKQVRRAKKGGGLTWDQVTGGDRYRDDFPELGVSQNVYDRYCEFRSKCEDAGIGPPRMIIEAFTLRGGARPLPTSDRHVLASARIGSLLTGMMVMDPDNVFSAVDLIRQYGPHESKGYATNDRLKRWGLWAVGMDHARDAARLVAIHLAKSKESGIW